MAVAEWRLSTVSQLSEPASVLFCVKHSELQPRRYGAYSLQVALKSGLHVTVVDLNKEVNSSMETAQWVLK